MLKRPAAKSMCGFRRLDAGLREQQTTISRKILKWRATADEDGHSCFAVALM
jgi:hypothetical protein